MAEIACPECGAAMSGRAVCGRNRCVYLDAEYLAASRRGEF